ncbi:MAG: hypothetical protein ACYC6N_06690 [Pirellulaceae bacterium]
MLAGEGDIGHRWVLPLGRRGSWRSLRSVAARLQGGSAVARELSQRLGYPCLSREEALSLAARDYGIVEAELHKSLDGSPRFWEEVPGK